MRQPAPRTGCSRRARGRGLARGGAAVQPGPHVSVGRDSPGPARLTRGSAARGRGLHRPSAQRGLLPLPPGSPGRPLRCFPNARTLFCISGSG